MMERKESKKPTGEEVEAQILTAEKQRLSRWYERWGKQPLYYSLLRTGQKLSILLIVLILFNRKVLNIFLDAPMVFLGNRWPLLLAGVVIIFLLHRFAWEKTAVKYYLLSLNDPELKAPAPDGSMARKGRASIRRINRRWQFWELRKNLLMMGLALALPLVFTGGLFLIHIMETRNWSLSAFKNEFEGNVLYWIMLIFCLAGAFIGWSIWHELKSNHSLIQNQNLQRER
jgi:hypothetical protein